MSVFTSAPTTYPQLPPEMEADFPSEALDWSKGHIPGCVSGGILLGTIEEKLLFITV